MLPPISRPLYKLRSIFGRILDLFLILLEKMMTEPNLSIQPQIKLDCQKVLILSVYINNEDDKDWQNIAHTAKSFGFEVIVVNTGKSKIEVARNLYKVVNRSNLGRDISSYALALGMIELSKLELIILMNDSLIWNLEFLTKIFSRSYIENNTIYGLTLSKQRAEHLQSYLLIFPKDSIFAVNVFQELGVYRFKRNLVRFGEIGASQSWSKLGYKLKPLLKTEDLYAGTLSAPGIHPKDRKKLERYVRKNIPINPTIHYWSEFYRRTHSIKKSLLNSNPAKLRIFPRTVIEAEMMSEINFLSIKNNRSN